MLLLIQCCCCFSLTHRLYCISPPYWHNDNAFRICMQTSMCRCLPVIGAWDARTLRPLTCPLHRLVQRASPVLQSSYGAMASLCDISICAHTITCCIVSLVLELLLSILIFLCSTFYLLFIDVVLESHLTNHYNKYPSLTPTIWLFMFFLCILALLCSVVLNF